MWERMMAEHLSNAGDTRLRPPQPAADEARMPAGLVTTKLIPPRPRVGAILRPRVLCRLDEVLHSRLTLLSAPAGSGKTTVIGEWLARQRCLAAWVSLDEGDNDLFYFWLYLATALEGACPGATESTLTLLREPQTPPLHSVATTLL